MGIDFGTFISYVSEWLGAIAVAWIFSINPLFRQKLLGFRYAQREAVISFSLFALIVVISGAYLINTPPQFNNSLPLGPAPILDLSQAMVLALIALLPIVVALFIRGQPLRSTGWDTTLIRPALSVGFASALLTIFLRSRIMAIINGITTEDLQALLITLGIALAEETVFRGYIQPRLSTWMGNWPGLVVTAVLFAAWRLVVWVNHLPVETILILFGLTLAQGLVLGWMMLKCRNVLAPALYRGVSIWLRLL